MTTLDSHVAAINAARPFEGHVVTTATLERIRRAVRKATKLPVKCDRENNPPIAGMPVRPVQIVVLDPLGIFILWLNQAPMPSLT